MPGCKCAGRLYIIMQLFKSKHWQPGLTRPGRSALMERRARRWSVISPQVGFFRKEGVLADHIFNRIRVRLPIESATQTCWPVIEPNVLSRPRRRLGRGRGCGTHGESHGAVQGDSGEKKVHFSPDGVPQTQQWGGRCSGALFWACWPDSPEVSPRWEWITDGTSMFQ